MYPDDLQKIAHEKEICGENISGLSRYFVNLRLTEQEDGGLVGYPLMIY